MLVTGGYYYEELVHTPVVGRSSGSSKTIGGCSDRLRDGPSTPHEEDARAGRRSDSPADRRRRARRGPAAPTGGRAHRPVRCRPHDTARSTPGPRIAGAAGHPSWQGRWPRGDASRPGTDCHGARPVAPAPEHACGRSGCGAPHDRVADRRSAGAVAHQGRPRGPGSGHRRGIGGGRAQRRGGVRSGRSWCPRDADRASGQHHARHDLEAAPQHGARLLHAAHRNARSGPDAPRRARLSQVPRLHPHWRRGGRRRPLASDDAVHDQPPRRLRARHDRRR